MNNNQQAYDAAYQRAIDGKSSRGLWTLVSSLFEDEYTRQSRLKGRRDGLAARTAAAGVDASASPVVG